MLEGRLVGANQMRGGMMLRHAELRGRPVSGRGSALMDDKQIGNE
jgi:hypothetical protein